MIVMRDGGLVNGEVMAAEMAEQPVVLARLAGRAAADVTAVRAVVPGRLAGVSFVARGSSDNAAVFGRYLTELACGRPAGLAAPSLYTRYHARVDWRGYLVVALSQSGATPEIVTTCEAMREAGAVVVGVSNEPHSPLAATADVLLPTDAGPELAIPATKTVTAQLALLTTVADALRPPRPDGGPHVPPARGGGDVLGGDADVARRPGPDGGPHVPSARGGGDALGGDADVARRPGPDGGPHVPSARGGGDALGGDAARAAGAVEAGRGDGAGQVDVPAGALAGLPHIVAAVLADPGPMAALAHRWAALDRLVVAGRGLGYAAALETALKVKETTGILAEGISTADLLHGPIAAVYAGAPVLLIDAGGPATADLDELRGLLAPRHADVVTLPPAPGTGPLAASGPAAAHEAARVIAAVVRGQQLAHELARARGTDPDSPAHLSKVTATT
jgi:fructoselysine-6-P-deglycase FrlB-like protein